jgi:hypothetical protein
LVIPAPQLCDRQHRQLLRGWLAVSANGFEGDMTDTPVFLREPPVLPRGGRCLDRDAAGFAQSAGFIG